MRTLLLSAVLGMASFVQKEASAKVGDVPIIPNLPISVSSKARDLIIFYEVGGQGYYRRYLQRPTYPGGASGVTVGFGYDCGYNSPSQIRKDWSGKLSEQQVDALVSVSGLKGSRAANEIHRIKWIISVPWETAKSVFEESTMPRFAALTKYAFPDINKAHPHGQGAILSIAFNRGTSMRGSSRREMRWIKYNLGHDQERIPQDIRSMKRIWVGKGLDGLLKRRDAEAQLFEKGLDMSK